MQITKVVHVKTAYGSDLFGLSADKVVYRWENADVWLREAEDVCDIFAYAHGDGETVLGVLCTTGEVQVRRQGSHFLVYDKLVPPFTPTKRTAPVTAAQTQTQRTQALQVEARWDVAEAELSNSRE